MDRRMRRHPLSVLGATPRARARLEVRSPYDAEVVGEVELAAAEDLEQALDQARALFQARAGLPLHERTAVLRRAAALLTAQAEALAALIAAEGGKPLVDARVEVARACAGMEEVAGDVERLAGEQIPMTATAPALGRWAFSVREPIGVVGAISAFNHPLNLIVHQVAPAVAAGCPVIVKPALETPLSAYACAEALQRAGLPPGWVTVLPCSNELAEQLASDARLAYLSFIGSARVGWHLRSRLAPGVRVGLEHGGAAPVIVDASARLEQVLPPLVKAAYYHAGQVCVSAQRVYVHRSRLEELLARLEPVVGALRVGDPRRDTTEVGPLIRAREVERVHAVVTQALEAGARLGVGGRALPNQSYAPTLLVEPPDDARVMVEEVFGPVLALTAFDELEHAIARANATRWAFQAAIFTQDLDRALAAASGLDAATVLINEHTAFRVDWMPFGGRRESGLGVGGLPYSLRELTQPKLVVLRQH